ncbi:FAD-binding protein, partial [Chloroflexota bacterium]
HAPFSTADNGKYLDIAAYKETFEGRGTEDMGLYVDFTHISEGDLEKSIETTKGGVFGGIEAGLNELSTRGINIFKKPFEVIPCPHAFNGGLRINERVETTLPGLYAIGETAAGPHGADRLGGNMVATCQVFGARAGKFAVERADDLDSVTIDQGQIDEECNRVSRITGSQVGIRPQEIGSKIRDVMWKSCLTVRNQRGLENCIEELRRLRDEELPKLSAEGDTDLFRVLEIPNLLDVGEILTHAALQRTESRGSHFREDYPNKDDENWLRTIDIRQENLNLR